MVFQFCKIFGRRDPKFSLRTHTPNTDTPQTAILREVDKHDLELDAAHVSPWVSALVAIPRRRMMSSRARSHGRSASPAPT